MENTEDIYLLDKLRPPKGYETTGALLCTYSIDAKALLSALLYMRDIPAKWMGSDTSLSITERLKILFDKGIEDMKWMEEHIVFVCNNGYDKSSASTMYQYTRRFTAYYTIPLGERDHSFHPKMYLVKFEKKDNTAEGADTLFLLIIGSMNLVNSHNKEFAACMELEAYREQDVPETDRDKYVKLKGTKADISDAIDRLLGYKRENGRSDSPYIDNRNIGKVIENLAVDSYYFKKDELPEITAFGEAFPGTEFKDMLKGADHIFSPFLSDRFLRECPKKTNIYTMENELTKLGYERCAEKQIVEDDDKTDSRQFYVYEIEENQVNRKPSSSHFKAYLSDKDQWVYVGSLNFSNRAFGNNRELVVKLQDITEQRYDCIKKAFQEDYGLYTYRKRPKVTESEEYEPDIDSEFRKLALQISQMYAVNFSQSDNYTLTVCRTGIATAQEKDNVGKLITSINESLTTLEKFITKRNIPEENKLVRDESAEYDHISVKICPVDYPERNRNLLKPKFTEAISEDKSADVLETEDISWSGLNRRKAGQQFILTLECKNKEYAHANIHICWCVRSNDNNEGESGEAQSQYDYLSDVQRTLIYEKIAGLLSNRNYKDASIDKAENESDDSGSRLGVKEYERYIRNCIPTLEELIQRCINEKKSLDSVITGYENWVKSIYEMYALRNRGMSQEEQAEIACMDKKLVENMMAQFECLKGEIGYDGQR